ncbi:Pheophorbide a oxygenase [Gracilaria domingensis]|nr:Pheophorbide a oxygenase [Gracilaria domingensis]
MYTAPCFSNVAIPSIWQRHSFNRHQWSSKPSRGLIPKFCFSSSFCHLRRTIPRALTANSEQRCGYSNTFCSKKEDEVKGHAIKYSQTSPSGDRKQVAHRRFDWFNQWYPVSLITDLDRGKPNAVQILDNHIVVWHVPEKDKDSWVAFHDRCPHRFAALSEGQRINRTTKNLECGYHGWQFNSEGKCSVIPQSEKAPSSLVCAEALSCVVRSGLLFVWMGSCEPHPDSGPAVIEDARAKYITSAYSRILPLCFTTLIQNVLDPAHIHFAHHGQIGRRELAAPIPVRILRSSTAEGFTADYYDGSVRLRYRPPCLIEIVTASGLSFAYYAVPVTAGLVRTFALRGTSRRPLFRFPHWLDHFQRNRLVEGDLELMITQQREMRKVSKTKDYAGSWGDFYMPTSSDRLIVEMKRWLHDNAPTQTCHWFTFCNDDQVSIYKSRFSGHTRQCSSCSHIRDRLVLLEGIAAALAAGAASCGMILSHEMRFVSSLMFGFSCSLFVVSRRLRKRLE